MKRSIFGAARAKKAAIRYNHPSRGVKLILVSGEYGLSTTALYLAGLLRQNGSKVAVFSDRVSEIESKSYSEQYDASADAVQRAIGKAKKTCDYVIMCTTEGFARSRALDTLHCEMCILTSDSDFAREVAEHPATYAVFPDTMSPESLSMSPHQLISYGDGNLAEARIRNVVLYKGGSEVEMTIDHQTTTTLSTYLLGRANAYNVAAAVAAAYLLGRDVSTFEEGIACLDGVTGNLEEIEVDQAYRVYVDGATNEHSVDLVSASMKQLAKRRLLIACDESFSDGSLDLLSERADRLTIVGGDDRKGRYGASSPKDAVETTLRAAKKDDVVLLFGPYYSVEEESRTRGESFVREVIDA